MEQNRNDDNDKDEEHEKSNIPAINDAPEEALEDSPREHHVMADWLYDKAVSDMAGESYRADARSDVTLASGNTRYLTSATRFLLRLCLCGNAARKQLQDLR